MTIWRKDELDRIGKAGELQMAPLLRDGALRSPVTIWVVRVGANLYVRSYRGRSGSWFRSAQRSQLGRIWAGGVVKDVAFLEETEPALNDQIDAAYRSKYKHSPYVAPMVTAEVRSTTIKLIPREPDAPSIRRKES